MDVEVVEIASGVWQARAKHVGWVLVVDGHEVTLVDTGYPGDHDRVIASLAQIGRSPADVAAVVLTHAHPDHLGSAEYFRTTVGKPVLVHALEVDNATGVRIEQVSIPTLMLAGDALMTEHALARSPGPQLLPGFFNHDNAQARESLDLLADLHADVVVPGHGPAFRGTPAEAVTAALAAGS